MVNVKLLRNNMRYDLLLDQFKIDKNMIVPNEIKDSLQRIFSYIYHQTDILYVEFIDEKVLNNYIKSHHANHFSEVCFTQCIRDIKNFIYYLEKIKGKKHLPRVDLSVQNLSFWERL